RGGDDRQDLRRPRAPIYAVPDQFSAQVWRQDAARERARKPALVGKLAAGLSLPPTLPARQGDLQTGDAALHPGRIEPQSCLLASRRGRAWKSCLKLKT